MIQERMTVEEIGEQFEGILSAALGSPVRFVYHEHGEYHLFTINDSKEDFMVNIKAVTPENNASVWELFTKPEGGVRWRRTNKLITKDGMEWVQ